MLLDLDVDINVECNVDINVNVEVNIDVDFDVDVDCIALVCQGEKPGPADASAGLDTALTKIAAAAVASSSDLATSTAYHLGRLSVFSSRIFVTKVVTPK